MLLYGKQQQMPNALIFILQCLINTQAAYHLKLKKKKKKVLQVKSIEFLNSFSGFDKICGKICLAGVIDADENKTM